MEIHTTSVTSQTAKTSTNLKCQLSTAEFNISMTKTHQFLLHQKSQFIKQNGRTLMCHFQQAFVYLLHVQLMMSEKLLKFCLTNQI